MAQINLKRFVDINIKQHVLSTVSGTRDTVVLFTDEGSSATPVEVSSYTEATQQFSTMATTLKYLKIFFACGGVKARVIENTPTVTNDLISALDNQYIIVASTNAGYATLKAIASAREADASIYGINEKIIVARTNTIDNDLIKNFAVKYASDSYVGAEMSISAYLTQINVYGVDTVYDYAYTIEPKLEGEFEPEAVSDTVYGQAITANLNLDVYLAGAMRNCGGNCKNGADLVNTYVRIILHQTLTDRLINLLSQKLKGTNGLGKIFTIASQELEQYKTAGYLTTDKVWTDPTWTVTINNVTYTIVEQGTALTNGYLVRVLPFSSLTAAQQAAHQAPPIYVVIADQYGIRSITINGEVI